MQWFNRQFLGCLLVGLGLVGLSACKKRADAARGDLGEAGFKLTTEDWFRASRENNVEVLKKFVAGGFAPDTRDSAGDTALHAAAAAGAEKAADYLLGRGLSADLRGAGGRTPLMTAVVADQIRMVRWLLRQGAAPRLKDEDGYTALLLAVREGRTGPVGELAIYTREDMDAAFLAAALVGKAEMLDTLTQYGASVYARMDDGRTALMLAAENGHEDAVKMLIDLGASRFATTPDGATAPDLATQAGHPELAAVILNKPVTDELALATPDQLAAEMDAYVEAVGATPNAGSTPATESDAAVATTKSATADPVSPVSPASPGEATPGEAPTAGVTAVREPRAVPQILDGRTLEAAPAGAVAAAPAAPLGPVRSGGPAPGAAVAAPIVMRHYREREMPLTIKTVEQETATVRIGGAAPQEVKVRAGETVPGTRLVVLKVQRRMQSQKDSNGNASEVSVVELKDSTTGATRELISGVPSSAHDPVALVEDARTGKRYLAAPGQRFRAAGGGEFVIRDVRPNQIVIEDVANGTVSTIPLRGPRG